MPSAMCFSSKAPDHREQHGQQQQTGGLSGRSTENATNIIQNAMSVIERLLKVLEHPSNKKSVRSHFGSSFRLSTWNHFVCRILYACATMMRGQMVGCAMLTLAFRVYSAVAADDALHKPASGAPCGPAPVNLGTAGNFVILAKAGITNVPTSTITGDIGVSPIAAASMTGFSLTADSSNQFATSAQINGKVLAANYASPTPSKMTTAISNMEAAYTDASSRANPDFNEKAGGLLGGLTLEPGLYKWTSSVAISDHVTIRGSHNDTWIFQITKSFNLAGAKNIILEGGAQAKNIVWVIAETMEVGAGAHMEGIVIVKTAAKFLTGASFNGRVLSQTAVTLQMNAITQPVEEPAQER
jgi:hypothetical protein